MASAGDEPTTFDRISARMLGGPLAWTLALLYAAQLALWVPAYLVRPYWSDLDVFQTMAQSWSVGVLPYRDVIGNNFPGTTYVFWALGKLFGWGKTAPFLAFDAALVVGFAAILVAWSARCFGRLLPGLIGAGAALSFFIGLNYSMSAQRDGQAGLLAAAGLLLIQARTGRAGLAASALLLAFAALIRPQVVAFLPAYWAALAEAARSRGVGRSRALATVAGWTLAVGALVAAGFVPLAMSGILGDFARSLRVVAYGSTYNRVTPRIVLERLATEAIDYRLFLLPTLAILAARRVLRPEDWRLARTWGIALLGVAFYAPLSPGGGYLEQPLWVVWSVHVAILAQLLLSAPVAATWRLLMVALLIIQVVAVRPAKLGPIKARQAIAALRTGQGPPEAPLGYTHNYPWVPLYRWQDYRDAIAYLRTSTRPETRVANALFGAAAAGPAGRLSAFPAESANWLFVVRRRDEPLFVEALERTPDSVVIWDPSREEDLETRVGDPSREEGPKGRQLFAAIRRLYRPEAKFGPIEVWARKPEAPAAGQ